MGISLMAYTLNFEKSILPENANLRAALKAISSSGAMMACITDSHHKLQGIITDSDIRRALLNGANLEDAVKVCTNYNPITALYSTHSHELLSIANTKNVREIPLLDEDGHLCDVFVVVSHQEPLSFSEKKMGIPNAMLILAGGEGKRLRPAVSDRPKPLASVGGRPILQTIIEHAVSYGITKFYIAVNYMADMIIDHLNDPIYKHLNIVILREKNFLGTAGALSLIEDKISHPLIISNGDVLTKVPLPLILIQHRKLNADATCVVRPHQVIIPYGVANIAEDRISSLVEKPFFNYAINSGIYVLSPDVCSLLNFEKRIDMPDFLNHLIQMNRNVCPFLTYEYWMDIGHPNDFYQANLEFSEHFERTYDE
jgi:dTDP-glucose pyrophosphorylase